MRRFVEVLIDEELEVELNALGITEEGLQAFVSQACIDYLRKMRELAREAQRALKRREKTEAEIREARKMVKKITAARRRMPKRWVLTTRKPRTPAVVDIKQGTPPETSMEGVR